MLIHSPAGGVWVVPTRGPRRNRAAVNTLRHVSDGHEYSFLLVQGLYSENHRLNRKNAFSHRTRVWRWAVPRWVNLVTCWCHQGRSIRLFSPPHASQRCPASGWPLTGPGVTSGSVPLRGRRFVGLSLPLCLKTTAKRLCLHLDFR